MSSKEKFVITIGDFGSNITLHSGNLVKENLFLENFNDESKAKVKALFDKYKSPPVSILLDNLDQTYKKKTYPHVNLVSLRNIAKREMDSDGDRNSFKNYIPFIPKKSSGIKKTECLYISLSRSEVIDEWLKFLLDLPNRVIGIYALPIESFRLFNLLRKKDEQITKTYNHAKLRHDLYCIVLQTRVGGIRQIVFSNNSIIFTRIVNYDLQDADWLEKYEQDIYSTFEYLKRSMPSINITELHVINILGEEILNKIKTLDNLELKILNHTPCETSTILGYKNLLTEEEKFSDVMLSKIFAKEKEVLKFVTPQIVKLEKLFLVLVSSYALNGIISLLTLAIIVSIIFFSTKTRSLVKVEEANKKLAQEELSKVKLIATNQNIEDGSNISGDIETIIDYGKINEALQLIETKNCFNFYARLSFLRDYNTIVTEFNYSLPNFNQKAPNSNTGLTVSFKGDMKNKNGDIDELFRNFDSLSDSTKKTFTDYSVSYSEIPRNIDFTKRYYTYPIEFTLQSK